MYTTCGQYQFGSERRLGSGGEAEVYAGTHTHTRTPVAVKVLRRGGGGVSPHEASVLSALPPHPSIIPAPAVAQCRRTRRAALVFPLYNGDLHSCAEAGGPMPEPVVRHVLQQLLAALVHLHAHGYSHNDVKLENMFVAKEVSGWLLTVVLGDFGLARPTLQVSGRVLGTDAFMSPEAYCMRKLTGDAVVYDAAAADVWSACVVAVMCLSLAGVGVDGGRAVFCKNGLSRACVAFLEAAFVLDPVLRPTAAQLLAHEWLVDAPPSLPTHLPSHALGTVWRGSAAGAGAEAGSGTPPPPHAGAEASVHCSNSTSGTNGSSAHSAGRAHGSSPVLSGVAGGGCHDDEPSAADCHTGTCARVPTGSGEVELSGWLPNNNGPVRSHSSYYSSWSCRSDNEAPPLQHPTAHEPFPHCADGHAPSGGSPAPQSLRPRPPPSGLRTSKAAAGCPASPLAPADLEETVLEIVLGIVHHVVAVSA